MGRAAPAATWSTASKSALGGEFDASRDLRAEAGYVLALFGDAFTGTPDAGFEFADGGGRATGASAGG